MRRRGGLHPYNGRLPATRVALPLRGNVRAEWTYKNGVAEQRNFLCEGGCLSTDTTAVADTRATSRGTAVLQYRYYAIVRY